MGTREERMEDGHRTQYVFPVFAGHVCCQVDRQANLPFLEENCWLPMLACRRFGMIFHRDTSKVVGGHESVQIHTATTVNMSKRSRVQS